MSVAELDARAREILNSNDRGGYTIPTEGLYPYQWNWDSVFVALGFATFDRDRAWKEIDTLFEAQWPDGMVPSIVFRADAPSYFPGPSVWQANLGPIPSTGISQPAVAASVVLALAAEDLERAEALYDKIDAWHRWWHRARDPEGWGVIGIIHPWESGRDNLPDWDQPGAAIDVSRVEPYERQDTAQVESDMRPQKADYDRYVALVEFGRQRAWDQVDIALNSPFFVADVGITAILLRAERDLAALGRKLGRDVTDIETRIARMETGFERLWNPEIKAYATLDRRTGTQAQVATAATFLSLYAGVTQHKDATLDLFENFRASASFGVPSYDPRSPLFDHVRYWRGPVWAIVNWMIAQGVREAGRPDLAEAVRTDTARLIRTSGFAEYFSPVDGQGCGGGTFSWTAAIWLAWELSSIGEDG